MGKPSRFVVCYTTRDGVHAVLHAYADGDGSLRDNNHVREIVREFTHGNEGEVRNRPPSDGERVMFEIVLHVCATRRGTSNGFDCKEQGEAGSGGWNDFSNGAVAAAEHGCHDWKPIEGYKGKESYREYLRTGGAK